MVMKKGMRYSPEVWKKITMAQKAQVYAFWKEKKTTADSTTVSVNSTEIQLAPTPKDYHHYNHTQTLHSYADQY
jgi:hypothetical protein